MHHIDAITSLAVPMPQQTELLWLPALILALLAIPPWTVVLLDQWSARTKNDAIAHNPAGRWFIVAAISVSAVLVTIVVVLWSAQYERTAHECVAGTYTTPNRAGQVTTDGCVVRPQGTDAITIPGPNQFSLISVSTWLSATLAIPPWLLIARHRRRLRVQPDMTV